jgi:hypothetical protein
VPDLDVDEGPQPLRMIARRLRCAHWPAA